MMEPEGRTGAVIGAGECEKGRTKGMDAAGECEKDRTGAVGGAGRCENRLAVALAVIGGGPAGLAAALAAWEAGIRDILILERDSSLGGILNQCIHNGFGLHTFQEELTGPEYAARFVDQVEKQGIPYKLETMVTEIRLPEAEESEAGCPVSEAPEPYIHAADNGDSGSPSQQKGAKVITAMNARDGILTIYARAVVLAMGCRERPRGALNIPGFRPAGIYSAGTAQRLVNIEGKLPGREVVILGSGDIGLIMARRMTLEGAKVKAVAELMPYSGGLKRNIVQCLNDFDIPLKLSTTVVRIHGKERVEGVTLAKVDKRRNPIPGTEEYIPCDTLLLSVGLLPENELTEGLGAEMSACTHGPRVNESMETSVEGVFACGNVLHVHDLVDYVSEEAEKAGRAAAVYLKERTGNPARTAVQAGDAAGNAAGSAVLAGAVVGNSAGAAIQADDAAGNAAGAAVLTGAVVRNSAGAAIQAGDAAESSAKAAIQADDAAGSFAGTAALAPIRLEPGTHVRYTVPSLIRLSRAEDEILVRFRVDDVLKDSYLCVYFDDEPVSRKKKRILAPGEMEQVVLKKAELAARPDLENIRICVEDAQAADLRQKNPLSAD